MNALDFGGGDQRLAHDLADEIIHQRYNQQHQLLNAGLSRQRELVSCFLIQSTDDMNTIGRPSTRSTTIRIGGGVGTACPTYGCWRSIKHIEGAASGVVP